MSCIGKIIGGFSNWRFWGQARNHGDNITSRRCISCRTLSGNPIAVSAGLSTLNLLIHENKKLYSDIESKALRLKENILTEIKNIAITQLGSMLTIFYR